MKAAVYARVSTDQQSVKGQIEYAESWTAKNGYTLVGTYIDPAKSGTIPFSERDGGRRLLDDARAGRISTVLVYKFDRLGRDKDVGDIEVRQAILDIERTGAAIVSMTQPVDVSTPTGRMMRSIHVDMGAIERHDILERSSDRLQQLVKVPGFYSGGTVPYGYAVKGEDEEARLILDSHPIGGFDESPVNVVELIFRWIADDGRSTVWVAAELNRRGIPTKYALDIQRGLREGRVSSTWRPSRISRMLHNTIYKGIAVYGKSKQGASPFPVPVTEREMPAIVDVDTWDRAQAALRTNSRHSRRNRKRDYLLSGLVICGACEAAYTGKHYVTAAGEERRYYTCNNVHQRHNTGGEKCGNPALSWQYEDLIWSDIDAWRNDPGPILDELAGQINAEQDQGTDVESEIADRRRDLKSKEGERARLLTVYRKGIIDDDELELELSAIRNEVYVLEEEINTLEHSAERLEQRRAQLVTARTLLDELRARGSDGMSFEVKQQVVRTLVQRIVVQPDGIPDVRYRFAPATANPTEIPGGTVGWAAPG